MKRRLLYATTALLLLVGAVILNGLLDARRSAGHAREAQQRLIPTLRLLEQARFGAVRVVSSTSELLLAKVIARRSDNTASSGEASEREEAEQVEAGVKHLSHAVDALRALYPKGQDNPIYINVTELELLRDQLLKQSQALSVMVDDGADLKALSEARESFEQLEVEVLEVLDRSLRFAQNESDEVMSRLLDEVQAQWKSTLSLGLMAVLALLAYAGYVLSVLKLEAQARQRAETLAEEHAAEVKMRRQIEGRLAAHQKMEAMGTLVGGIAHSVNNYLAPIVTLSKMLLQDLPAGSEAHGDVARILSSADKASALLRQVLRFSRGSGDDASDRCDLAALLHRTLPLAQASLPSAVQLRQRIGLQHALVPVSETTIDTVLLNLIGNASDAMQGGRGTIKVTLDRLDLDATVQSDATLALRTGAYARLVVADDGRGIPKDVQGRIFEPFFTTKEVGKGTGLGLSIAYTACTEAGGDIQVHSEPGQGTRFTLLLPLLDEPASPAAPPDPRA